MILRKGLKFSSRNFSAKCEVHEINNKANEITLIMMPSDRHDFYVTWPLDQVIQGFKDKIYTEYDPKNVNNYFDNNIL